MGEGLPKRGMLRPGVRVVRSDDRHLRVGLGPASVLLPDTRAMRGLLAALSQGRDLTRWDEATVPAGARLAAAGLLTDGQAFWAAVRSGRAAGLTDQVVADLFADDLVGDAADAGGRDPTDRLRRRLARWVRLDVPDGWRRPVADLLAACGVVDRPAEAQSSPAARLIGRLGEPRREELDPLVRSEEPHLLLRVVEGRVVVGPFVALGSTACCRCVDAHLSERDPRRPLVVAQYADPAGQRLVPEPVSPTLLALGWAHAVDDLVAFVDGREPVTWSGTLEFAGGPVPRHRRFARHPHCGCSWGDALALA